MKISFNQILVILATLLTITVNGLANALPINGMNTGQVSDNFDVFFVPAGYVFSIWGLIYILLVAFTIYQALPAQKDNPVLKSIRGWYVIGCLANSIWIFAWHYLQFNMTIMLMTILLVSLLLIYKRLRKANAADTSSGMRWFVQLPFSVYLGWITVATIANVTDVLDFNKWNGFGIAGETWAIIMLVVAVMIAVWMMLAQRDWPYLAVLAWAFAGIGVKFAGESIVATAAYAAAVIAGILLVAALLLRVKDKKQLI
jgi:hypothetical protein